MPNLGAPELLIILAVAILLFGSSRVPKLARSLGQAQHELKAGLKGRRDDPGPGSDTHTDS